MELKKFVAILLAISVLATALGVQLLEPWMMHWHLRENSARDYLGYASLSVSPVVCLCCAVIAGRRRRWFAGRTLWHSGWPMLGVLSAFLLSWAATAFAGLFVGAWIQSAMICGEMCS